MCGISSDGCRSSVAIDVETWHFCTDCWHLDVWHVVKRCAAEQQALCYLKQQPTRRKDSLTYPIQIKTQWLHDCPLSENHATSRHHSWIGASMALGWWLSNGVAGEDYTLVISWIAKRFLLCKITEVFLWSGVDSVYIRLCAYSSILNGTPPVSCCACGYVIILNVANGLGGSRFTHWWQQVK